MTPTAVLDVLTLGQKEQIRGRFLRQCDADGEPWYCVDCLADLPADYFSHWEHRCEIEPAPVLVEHKTRTTQPSGYVQDDAGCRRFDKRGRVMHDPSSWALCSCGWVAAGATREEARSRARAHRDEFATTLKAALTMTTTTPAGIRKAIAERDWDAVPGALKVGGKPDARVAACFAHSIPLHGCVSWPEELAGLITPAEED